MTTTPRIRSELQAQAAEADGIRYFDVTDPKSGAKMRLYEFEWLIAERMDGATDFSDVAKWAKERLGVDTNAKDLADYAVKLGDFGFFHFGEVDYTPLPEVLTADEDLEIETEAPVKARPPIPMPISPPPPLNDGNRPFAPREVSQVTPVPTPEKSSAASLVLLLMVILGLGGAAGYYFFFMKHATTVQVVLATPRDVARYYDGTAAVKRADPQPMIFGEAGKVVDVVAAGTKVKVGTPLATLDGYSKIEKDQADVRDRQGFYEKQLAFAKSKNDDGAAATAEAKVNEKKKLLGELDAKAAKLRLVAPTAGTVSEAMVKVGDDIKSGAVVVKLADQRLTAQFKLPIADAAKLSTGALASLAPGAGPGSPMQARIAQIDGGVVTVELLDPAALNAGDNVRLVKSKLDNVVKLPAAAVGKREGADVVYVLTGGEAKARPVTIVDREGTDVLVSKGLATGDSVISDSSGLEDGQKATTQP